METANKLARKSNLTEKDVEEFSKKVKASATKRFMDDIYNFAHKVKL